MIRKVACPACGGPGCEQCDGYGYVYEVPNSMGAEEAQRQIAELEEQAHGPDAG